VIAGKIITAAHVVHQSTKDGVEVIAANGHVHRAEVIKVDRSNDLAELQIIDAPGSDFNSLQLGSYARVGDPIVILGHPRAAHQIFASTGTISSLDTMEKRAVRKGQVPDLSASSEELKKGAYRIKAHSHIESGDSGAAVFDAKGDVIGTISQGDKRNIAIASPLTPLRHLLDNQSKDYQPQYVNGILNAFPTD